ncbi:hypothetical protein [Streptomyces venezuelae]|uniref:hypothetical protein n=1 Tax=Streptomyces venezuelae TaxID=54571 RepID=UPI00123DA6C3|nr:hypothetical protein [Streptomyces venezuelae]
MARGVRGVRGRWCGALVLAGVLVGGASGCGTGAAPTGGGTATGTSRTASPATPTSGTPSPGTATSGTASPGTASPGTATSPGADGPASPPAGGTGTAEPRPGEVLVEVVVNGGLAGVRNQLVILYDGSWTSRSGGKPPRTGRLTPAEAAELRAALEDPAYARVPERPAGGPVADGFQYFVTYRHRLVVAGDGERPPALRRVFAALPDGGPPTTP